MNPEPNQTDDNVFEIVNGSADAWKRLLAGTIPQLYGMYIKRGVHPALAEELTQKTVFDAIRARTGHDPSKGSPRQWLFAIASNNLALEMRQRQTRPHPDSDLLQYLEALDTQPLPDEMLEHKETALLVQKAILQLNPNEQAALRAKYLDDLSARDIAERLDLTEKAVHSLLYRARIALRDKLIQLAPHFKEEQTI
jgi:RNA polymerase sigma-70 factor (ECF subfamily)